MQHLGSENDFHSNPLFEHDLIGENDGNALTMMSGSQQLGELRGRELLDDELDEQQPLHVVLQAHLEQHWQQPKHKRQRTKNSNNFH